MAGAGTGAGGAGRAAGAAVAAAGFGDVEHRVAVEETVRLERELGVVDRHDRPVLRAREVGQAERVPEDHVRVFQVAVRGGIFGQPVPAGVLVDQVAGRVTLLRVVGGDPQ